jgi:hypothetical protein
MTRWSGPSWPLGRRGTSTSRLHRESVVWSGVLRARPSKPIREATKPSVWRRGRWKTVRKVNAVTIARSEYLRCPPGRPLGDAFHAKIDSSPNQTVMSPRSLRAISYAAQFFTRYFVLYFGVTLVFVRAAISDPPRVSIQGTGSFRAHCDVNKKSRATTPIVSARLDPGLDRVPLCNYNVIT